MKNSQFQPTWCPQKIACGLIGSHSRNECYSSSKKKRLINESHSANNQKLRKTAWGGSFCWKTYKII